MPNPEMHGYEPEPPKPPEGDPWKAAVLVQRDLVGRLPDEESRIRWVTEHGADFRKMFDEDPDFHDLVMKGDLDAVEEKLKRTLH